MQTVSDNRHNEKPPKTVFITDLDQSDVDAMAIEHRKVQKKRTTERKPKTLHTISGNFNRSRSAECNVRQVTAVPSETGKTRSSKMHNYLNDLLQTKEREAEKLIQRIVVLQEYNEQFAEENNQLREQVRNLEQNVANLENKRDACESCQQLTAQVTELKNNKRNLESDLAMLKNLVYRLNVQIEAYQDKQRRKQQQESHLEEGAGGDSSGQHNAKQKNLQAQAWQLAAPLYTQTLGPLLQSYDEVIRDKDELFQQYKQEFEHFSGELKRVLEENNALLQQHEQLKREVGSWREERTRLQAAVDVCRKKAEAHAQNADLAKEKLVEVVQVYEQRLQSLGLEVEHVQSAYARCKAELTQLKTLQAQPQDSIVSSLQQCKELLERLKQEHFGEKQQLQQQISELSKRSLDSDAKIKTLRQENASLKQDNHQQLECMAQLKQQLAAVKTELDHTQRSRARLKARLRMALQWAQKLEKGQSDLQGTWDALKRLETIVKHKEAQVRGLHARHLEEIDKMHKKLTAKEHTIRNILKSKVTPNYLHRRAAADDPAQEQDSP